MCRHPEKLTFRTIRMAARAVLEQHDAHGRSFRIYRCACDSFHLTSDVDPLTSAQLTQLKEVAR